MEQFDLVAIGDTVIDAFIRLKDAHVTCDVNKEHCQICMNFSDKIPYEDVYVIPAAGNSPNVAVAAAKLGLKTALISNIGNDQNGQNCLATFARTNVNTSLIKVEDGVKTNYHYVLWYGDDRTILVKHEKYKYSLPDFKAPAWIYLSSIGEDSIDFHYEIMRYLENHHETKLAFQPGTFQIKFGYEKMVDLYKRCELFFCNKEEAQKILKTEEDSILILSQKLNALGPKTVVITDSQKGAYAYSNGILWQVPAYPYSGQPVERTGAGDALAATFTTAIALGKTVPDALAWGPINSSSVIGQIGSQAGLLTREELEKRLAEAPEGYQTTKV